MINTISGKLIDLVFGGSEHCICYGYAEDSHTPLVKISTDAIGVWTNTQYADVKTWCYNLVHYYHPPLKSWEVKCFLNNYSQGTFLSHFEDYHKQYSKYLFEQYSVITLDRTGIV